MMMYRTIAMKQLEQILDRHEGIFLLGVGSRASCKMCHMEGAVNIPREKLNEKMGFFPKDKTIICYCARDGQNMLVCSHLSAMGYPVINTANGLSSYRGKYSMEGRNLHR